MLTEIPLCRSLHSIVSVAKIDIIKIKLQNLVLGIPLLHLSGYEHFLNLTVPGNFLGKKYISCQLLGYGTGSLDNLASLLIHKCCPDYCLVINSLMAVEIMVLHYNKCICKSLRYL